MIVCRTCNNNLDEDQFYPGFLKYGNYQCKKCNKKYRDSYRKTESYKAGRKAYYNRTYGTEKQKAVERLWHSKNRKRINENSKNWAIKNPGKSKENARKWRANNKEKIRASFRSFRKKIRSTPRGRLNHRMGNMIRVALKENKCRRSWDTLTGYTVDELKKHIEKQFKKHPGMNWERFMMGEIHIDHKIPKSAFNYESPTDIDFKRCWALKNLQPMWAKENISKSDRIEKPYQPSLMFKCFEGGE